MKYLVTGGGTGGHIYPALSIIEKIILEDKEADILYIGTEDSLESELVTRAGYKFNTVRVTYLPRKISLSFFKSLGKLMLGLKDSFKIIKKFKPDITIGTGGYVSGPVVLISALMGIKTVIHEQNTYPGITNKILSKFVDKIFITFDEAANYFKEKSKVITTGNPIRRDIFNKEKLESYRKLKLNPEKFVIVSFGGSGGQDKLNQSMIEVLKKLPKDVQLIHVTGKRYYNNFISNLKNNNIEIDNKKIIVDYLHSMPEALNVADLVIASAGAISLSEISALGKPSILIPKAYTAENHQEHNARYFQDQGAAKMILEKDLTGEILANEILNLLKDKKNLKIMSKNSSKLGTRDAVDYIYGEIFKLLNE